MANLPDSSSLFVALRPAGRRAAWMRARRLVELHIEDTGRESSIGSIHLGRVTRVESGLGAAFVELGGSQPGFLPLAETGEKLTEGMSVIVQVTRDPLAGKGPRLTARPVLRGPLLALARGRRGISLSARITIRPERDRLAREAKKLAAPGTGLIVRSAAQDATAAQLAGDAARLYSLWREIEIQRDALHPPKCVHRELAVDLRLLRDHGGSFRDIVYDERRAAETAQRWCSSHGLAIADRIAYRRTDEWASSPADIEEEIDAALAPEVALTSGARLRFESGETLTAIDVDSGSNIGSHSGAGVEQTRLLVNLEAADEIARQIRLRNLGGIVVVDFIDLRRPEDRRRVVDRLRHAASDDPARCWVGTMSRLGLVEMTRQRRGPPLSSRLMVLCSQCEGAGRLPKPLSVVFGSIG